MHDQLKCYNLLLLRYYYNMFTVWTMLTFSRTILHDHSFCFCYRSTDATELESVVTKLTDKGVSIFAVGVGRNVDENELTVRNSMKSSLAVNWYF